jgi:hypothetical protein
MRRSLGTGCLAALLVLALFPGLARASWVGDNCRPSHFDDSHVRRKDALAYAEVARNEGYEWGGGCWNNNNRDDSPGAPDSNGEGPDCSGFTFKTWEMKNPRGTGGFRWYDRLENIHGGYASYHFHSPQGNYPFSKISKSRSVTMYMDAFAKNGHVGMLYTESNPGAGTDYIIEARGEAYGTDVWERSYRGDSAYIAIRREGWTPDCWPNCSQSPATQLVVVP